MPALLRRAFVLALVPAVLSLAPGSAAAGTLGVSKAGGATGLSVRVGGLPSDVMARITVRGPRFSRRLTRSRTFTGLRPGTYRLTVRSTVIRRARKGVRAGSIVLPLKRTVTVKVKRGQRPVVRADYGTIVNRGVRKLTAKPSSKTGDPTNPTSIVLPATSRVRAGQILTAKPSSRLVAGLFHRVVSVRASGSQLVVRLTPAHLTDAFPQLDIDSHIKLAPGRVNVGSARGAAFDPLVASLGMGNFRCSLPVADSHFNAVQRFDVDADLQLHIPHFGPFATGLPSGRLVMTFSASASLDALLRKNAGCSANLQLPPVPGAIPVGPVVIPVYLRAGVSASASVAADLTAKASAGFSVQAGMAFNGTHVDPISSATATASASAGGEGKISAGPTLRLAVGVASATDVHFDLKPALAFTAGLDRSCSLDLVGASQVGISVGPFQLNENIPPLKKNLYTCPRAQASPAPAPTPPGPSGTPAVEIAQRGPLGSFPNQSYAYTQTVTNTGTATAHGVRVVNTLPTDGSFVSSTPAGTPANPAPGASYTVALGDIPAGTSVPVALRWRAPGDTATVTNSAIVQADDAPQRGPVISAVQVGSATRCSPCGAVSAGTGLRNRDHGSIKIEGIPAGATVGRAVLVWGILYNGVTPSNAITFQGHPVTADVASNVSGNLCWSDSETVGYAADVTSYVTGNGTFDVTDPPRGITRADNDPAGTLPYTDGASLVVLYDGGGAGNQVISDFSYDTDTDADHALQRSFSGINSVGGAASLTLAGPDGQNNGGETFSFTGAGETSIADAWDGSDGQDGPSFPIGNLWDTDTYDVSSLLPSGQSTLTFDHTMSDDCIGVGASVLQTAQAR